MKLKLLKSLRAEHPLTDPRNWTKPGVHIAPEFDLAGYQEKINKILSPTVTGDPIVRVKWAWDCRKWENVEWDEFGNATRGEWRQKYRALTVELGDGDYVDISPPRFVLEERYEPAQYADSWERTRYGHDAASCQRCRLMALGFVENSTSCQRRDVWGPYPREGWYTLLASPAMPYPFGVVAEHDDAGKCCKKLWANSREICYGRFKFPGGLELRILERAVTLRNQDAEVDPHAKELSPAALEQAKSLGLQAMQDAKVGKREELKAMYADEVLVHGANAVSPQALLGLKEAGRRVPIHRTIFS